VKSLKKNIEIYKDDRIGEICEDSKKKSSECLKDFDKLMNIFEDLLNKEKLTKHKLMNCLLQNVPIYFKAKMYGECVMSMLANVNADSVNIQFDNIYEYRKFVIMMIILFKKKFTTYDHSENRYWCTYYFVSGKNKIKNCPCSYHYLCEYGDPLHTKVCKININDENLKIVVNYEEVSEENEYGLYFEENEYALYFEESDITWQNINGKLDFSLLNKDKNTIEHIKENLINKKLTVKNNINKYISAENTIKIIQLYYKNVYNGFTIDKPCFMNINLIFKINIVEFKKIFEDIIQINGIINIVYEYINLLNNMTCAMCEMEIHNKNFAVNVMCKCYLNKNNLVHIKCLNEIAVSWPIRNMIKCKICNKCIFEGSLMLLQRNNAKVLEYE